MRASPTDILARKCARRTKVRRQVGELNGPRTAAGRAEVGEEVRVGVGVCPMEFKLTQTDAPGVWNGSHWYVEVSFFHT